MTAGGTGEARPASPAANGRTKFFVPIAAAAIILMYLYGTIPHLRPEYADWDLHDYLTMARASPGLAGSVRQPFVFRILAPWFAGLPPFPVETGFLLLTALGGISLAILFFLYLSAGGAGAGAAATATTLFLFNKYAFGFPVWN